MSTARVSSVVTEVEWINPHIYLHLEVTEGDGSVTRWQLETGPAVLAEPWQQRPRIARLADRELVEAAPCIERDLPHMQDLSHHDNVR